MIVKRTELDRTPGKSGIDCRVDSVSITRQTRADEIVSDVREGGIRSTVAAWYDGDRDFDFFSRK